MEDMRNNPPKKLGKYNVLSVGDYLTGKIKIIKQEKKLQQEWLNQMCYIII